MLVFLFQRRLTIAYYTTYIHVQYHLTVNRQKKKPLVTYMFYFDYSASAVHDSAIEVCVAGPSLTIRWYKRV